MRKSSLFFVLVMMAAAPSCTMAAEAPADFESALREALTGSLEMRRDGLDHEVAKYDVMRARSAFLPRMDISVDDSRISLLGDIPGVEALQLGGRSSAQYATSSLKLSINVFNGGQDQARLDHANEKQRESTLQLERRRTQVAQRLLDRFHAVRQAQFDLLAADLKLGRSRRTLADIETGVASGRTPNTKKLDAEFDVKDKELEQARRHRIFKGTMEDLLEMTGQTAAPRPTLANGWPEAPDYTAVLPRFGLAPENVITDVALYESRRLGAITDLPKARGRFAPSVDLFAKQDYSGVSTDGYFDALHQSGKDKRFVGFAIRWNLFEGFDALADVRQSALRVESAQADLDLARLEQRKVERERARTLAIAQEELTMERQRLDLLTARLEVDRLKVEIGRAEPSVQADTEVDLRLQSLEVRRHEESLAYARAMQVLLGGGQT